MNYGVVPLSAWHVIPHFSTAHLLENIAAMVLFGLIVARMTEVRGTLSAARFQGSPESS